MPDQPPTPSISNASSVMSEGMDEMTEQTDNPLLDEPKNNSSSNDKNLQKSTKETSEPTARLESMSDQELIDVVVDEWERRGNGLDELHEQLNDNLLYKRIAEDTGQSNPSNDAEQTIRSMME